MCNAHMAPSNLRPAPRSLADLFAAFTWLAMQGFGGVLAISQTVLVEEKRWLTLDEYLEYLALSQMLPGATICNVALIVGRRFFGWRGAAAALGGLMSIPLFVVLGFTLLYVRFAAVPAVSGALAGMSTVAAGFIVGTALKMIPGLRGNPLRGTICAALVGATFVTIGILRWPAGWVLPVIGALAFAAAWPRTASAEETPSSTREGTP
jgi:chromate transporter